MGREYFTFPLKGAIRTPLVFDDIQGSRFTPGPQHEMAAENFPGETLGASPFALKLARFARQTGRAPTSIRSLMTAKRTFEPGVQLMQQGLSGGVAYIIEDGWTFSSNLLRNGARQILDTQIPGDVAGFQSLARSSNAIDLTAMTRVVATEIRFSAVMKAASTDPHLSAFFFWLSSIEHAIASERLAGIGRRSSIERMAHLILELSTRLRLSGLRTDAGFACPMTQYLIGDALGLTSVHVNRVLRDLRTQGLAHYHRGWISLLDVAALHEISGFDDAYLTSEDALLPEAV